LRAVVQIALQPPPCLVGRSDDALAGRPEILDQPYIPQHQTRLRGHVPDQPFPGRRQRFSRRASNAHST
jgi:hypothetical protein